MKIGKVSSNISLRSLNNQNNVIFGAKRKGDSVEISSQKPEKKGKVKDFFKRNATKVLAFTTALASGLAAMFAVKNNSINKQKQKVEEENNKLKNEIDNIVLPDDFEQKVQDAIEQISAQSLDYDTLKPVNIKYADDYDLNLPEYEMPSEPEHTDIRSDAVKLEYPVFETGKPYHFEFPTSPDMKITHCETTDFEETELIHTNISESYADSLNWDNNKISRDLLQNFYDGHGQTLDGVKFDVEPLPNGKHKVRISGKSTFNHDKAIMLGESSKKDNEDAAGYFGEGLKMVVLKLLREKGADNVNIASDNWKVNWTLDKGDYNDKNVLSYQLTKQDKLDGNYLEFETDNAEFIESIINSFDRLYHYNNPAFKCPDFENEYISIKNTDETTSGNIFISGQAFETKEDFSYRDRNPIRYDALKGLNINIKKRPPKNVIDPSRDRIALDSNDMEHIGRWIAKNISDEDCVKLINSLRNCWKKWSGDVYGKRLLSGILDEKRSCLKIKFPDDKDVAAELRGMALENMYEQAGYKICLSGFKYVGMKGISKLIEETRAHKPVEPSEKEKNQLLILKEAIKLLSPILEENQFFSADELDTKIYLFDRTKEDESYKNVLGESIVQDKKCLGFWFDKGNFEGSFSNALSTALHELTHKYGGDESSIFSYKLTDVLEKVFNAISNNPNLATQMKVLEQAWESQKN